MIDGLPIHISIVFGLTSLLTVWMFYMAAKKSKNATVQRRAWLIPLVLLVWLGVQSILSLSGLYSEYTEAVPPTIVIFGVLPALLTIVVIFATRSGRRFADGLSLTALTYMNAIRIPVELVLYWLFLNAAVPQIMTFEGQNFDILAGITAPFVAYFAIQRKGLKRTALIVWNCLSLVLLLNIVITAVLAAPSPFQAIAFDQPNKAILYFPFNWLPTCVVPIVILGHVVSLRQLLRTIHKGE